MYAYKYDAIRSTAPETRLVWQFDVCLFYITEVTLFQSNSERRAASAT